MNYNKAEKISLIRAINSIDWDDSFVEAKVSEFNKLLLNICRNYILNKSVLWDHKDRPWTSDEVRTAIKIENDAYKDFFRSGIRQNHYAYLENLTT